MTKKYLVVGALISLVALIAACGGGSDDASSSGGSSAVTAPTATTAPAPTAKPAGATNAELVKVGKKEFGTCAGCHGTDAKGITGLGKDLVDSEFVGSLSDSDLAAFIKVGRPSSDPANTTGVDMPPKGGNPALNDEKIAGLVAYIRSLR